MRTNVHAARGLTAAGPGHVVRYVWEPRQYLARVLCVYRERAA